MPFLVYHFVLGHFGVLKDGTLQGHTFLSEVHRYKDTVACDALGSEVSGTRTIGTDTQRCVFVKKQFSH